MPIVVEVLNELIIINIIGEFYYFKRLDSFMAEAPVRMSVFYGKAMGMTNGKAVGLTNGKVMGLTNKNALVALKRGNPEQQLIMP